MTERAYRHNVGGYQTKYKIKKEEPDEERLTKQDNENDNLYAINQLKQDLNESKNEVK
jgi:hypothetical protein